VGALGLIGLPSGMGEAVWDYKKNRGGKDLFDVRRVAGQLLRKIQSGVLEGELAMWTEHRTLMTLLAQDGLGPIPGRCEKGGTAQRRKGEPTQAVRVERKGTERGAWRRGGIQGPNPTTRAGGESWAKDAGVNWRR